ncbi:phosphotransferase [Knoellia sinensis]|uniref:phosphotransferase n=1 Tax=Knoellia sinensis TaxID=136100 RepID=UPI000AA18B44|nr:phosphotransferase [Knoellia sinensis]
MSDRIHDDEADTSVTIVRALLDEQCPQWADLELHQLLTSGTDNAMWRISPPSGPDHIVRLPRTEGAAASLVKELTVLPALADRLPVRVPTIAYAGQPSPVFSHPWAVVEWLDGGDAWQARSSLLDPDTDALAADLAETVRAIGAITDIDVPNRVPGTRGGPLLPLLVDLEQWLTDEQWDAARLLDVEAVRNSAAESAEAATAEIVADRFVHGDLIPGNILVSDRRLQAIIDWGGAGIGDAALDLVPAWSILDRRGRGVFRAATGATETAWLRARAFALQQAVGGVLYYVPRGHQLGEVMRRTLARILSDR